MSKPNMFRMVFNDIASEVLDQHKSGAIDRQQALTRLNKLVDYVRESENENNKRNHKADKSRPVEALRPVV